MIVASAIQSEWSGDANLIALVPAERVFTAQAAGEPALPYVVARYHAAEPRTATTHRRVEAVTWEIIVWAYRFDAAAEVLDAVQATFGRLHVTLGGEDCLDFQVVESWVEPDEQGRWRGVARLRVRGQFQAAA